jgi:uncharacterized protein (DUF362 family)/Pyruvate/2-oxoacid:ferredoxin oxidoreductase delta subunit
MVNKAKIAIQKIKNDDIKTAVFSALELINAEQLIIREGMIILLKPNILMPKPPERAVTTHPDVIRAVVQWLKQFNPAKIYVCDSSGGQKPDKTEEGMEVSGISAICKKEGVECIPFEKTEREIYKVPEPLELKEFASSKLLKEADLIINVPKIKTHSQCILTCCIKNMFGTILRANKAKTHAQFPTLKRFSSALADIYSVSNPQLTIIDGYLCQEGQGPSSGDIVKLDLILAGYDAVALDTTVCKIIGFNPKEILYLKKAEGKGLGTTNLMNIRVLGEKIEGVYRKFKPPKVRPVSFPLPKWLANYVGNKIFKATVKFDPKKCKLCATCWSNCPVDAIIPPKELRKGNIPKWNKKRCITCFCCGELCPHQAVNFKINYVKNAILSKPCLSLLLIVLCLILFYFFLF